MSNKGTLQAELDKIPPTTENNVLDLNKYQAIEGKQFGVNLNGQMGVQMNPLGFYTNKPDFSTIYTSDGRTLQDVLNDLENSSAPADCYTKDETNTAIYAAIGEVLGGAS
jgi:hypothetical protein